MLFKYWPIFHKNCGSVMNRSEKHNIYREKAFRYFFIKKSNEIGINAMILALFPRLINLHDFQLTFKLKVE